MKCPNVTVIIELNISSVIPADTESACARFNLILSLMSFVPFQLNALVCLCCCSEILALFQTLQRYAHTHSHIDMNGGIIMEGGSDL